ncbi:hypothetical protein RF55_8236 [Lasius niger]|uniref:Uncharacterized protein n=1 Tax=Lasius niger TaxID=67767 RepID=A0A0J7NH47_LASNI|nr:hypothetical protein RF55_8236 [Lasius niger]
MSRPRDCGLVAAYAICRGYQAPEDRALTAPEDRALTAPEDRALTALRNETRQKIRDLTSYCRKYVREGHSLRIEEVLTFDQRRLPADNMSLSLDKYRVFDDEAHAFITDVLIERRLVYRFHRWKRYFDVSIMRELRALHTFALDGLTSDTPWTSCFDVNLVVRCELRAMYFVHGRSHMYNYNTVRRMLSGGTKERSVVDDMIRLRPMFDNDDDLEEHVYRLYGELPSNVMRAVRLLWYVQKILPTYYDYDNRTCNFEGDDDNENEDQNDKRALRYLFTAYAMWSYTRGFLKPEVIGQMSDVDLLHLAKKCY